MASMKQLIADWIVMRTVSPSSGLLGPREAMLHGLLGDSRRQR